MPSPETSSPPSTSSRLSPSTTALLALTQDITALISLSVEATASIIHDWFRSTLGVVGVGDVVATNSRGGHARARAESGRGLAVVVVGASEATGQSLTLHLAKSGYTVFPLVPLPSPTSPPTSAALSHLLLTWSGIQKRLRARHLNHPGAVVPVIVDPENVAEESWQNQRAETREGGKKPAGIDGPPHIGGRFGHAGETVRAYCKENRLALVAIVCASRKPRVQGSLAGSRTPNPASMTFDSNDISRSKSDAGTTHDANTTRKRVSKSSKSAPPDNSASTTLSLTSPLSPRYLPASALTMTDEQTLLSLYRTNVLDPLSVIRELSDLLAETIKSPKGRGRGRVVFVNGGSGVGITELEDDQSELEGVKGAIKMIGAARSETARLLREELDDVGIDVCEVVVGPMSPRIGTTGYHLRQNSGDSTDLDVGKKKMITDAMQNSVDHPALDLPSGSSSNKHAVLTARLNLLSRIWAVDDALLYSSVRRAIEDRYPRYRHLAGLSPLLNDLAEGVPGGGLVRYLGRWAVGRLLTPRGGSQFD
ncbi:hypothetical protein IAR55_002482 [Kwoniella newhampshirensis]|uniref:YjeF N-terminal domain-containing protein n=1 Tax=Kwoniella newhampshirensis TaxID=1651941 RepID=A0AAW0YTK8_9TREE